MELDLEDFVERYGEGFRTKIYPGWQNPRMLKILEDLGHYAIDYQRVAIMFADEGDAVAFRLIAEDDE